MSTCVDCGGPTMGTRCRPCNGAFIALRNAYAHEQSDNRLLAEVDAGLNADRLAARLGVSRERGRVLIAKAKRRRDLLSKSGSGRPPVPWPFRPAPPARGASDS